MDPLITLKRPAPVYFNICIPCQEGKQDNLLNSTERGLSTLLKVTQKRKPT